MLEGVRGVLTGFEWFRVGWRRLDGNREGSGGLEGFRVV